MEKKKARNCVKSMKLPRFAKKFHELFASVESFNYFCR